MFSSLRATQETTCVDSAPRGRYLQRPGLSWLPGHLTAPDVAFGKHRASYKMRCDIHRPSRRGSCPPGASASAAAPAPAAASVPISIISWPCKGGHLLRVVQERAADGSCTLHILLSSATLSADAAAQLHWQVACLTHATCWQRPASALLLRARPVTSASFTLIPGSLPSAVQGCLSLLAAPLAAPRGSHPAGQQPG